MKTNDRIPVSSLWRQEERKMEAEKIARAVARMRADLTIVSPLHNLPG